MKKLSILFLTLVMMLSFHLSGCNLKNDATASKPAAATNLAGRYCLYASENQLYCFDVATGKKTQISTGTDVKNVLNAMVSEENSHMLIEIATTYDEESNTLLLWDGKSSNATLVDTDATLVRVNQGMDHVVYTKGSALYEYRNNRTETLSELYYKVSVSEDCSTVLMTAFPEELLTDPEFDGSLSELNLIYKKNGRKEVKISTITLSACYPSATPDHSVVCYTKGPSGTSLFEPYPVYMWTPEGGEVELPFDAINIRVHSESEIYYITGDSSQMDLYYYNGKESRLLYENVNNHMHKLSDDLTFFRPRYGSDGLLVHKGTVQEIPGMLCPQKAILGVVSDNGKSVYTYSDETWYKTRLEDNEKLTVNNYFTGPERPTMQNELFAYEQDGALYCNGQFVEEGVDRYDILYSGELYYKRDGKLYCWENGQSKAVAILEDAWVICCIEKNLVIEEDGEFYFMKGSEKTLITNSASNLTVAMPWAASPTGGVYTGGAKTGYWSTVVWDLYVYY